jgi:hypothetical protein
VVEEPSRTLILGSEHHGRHVRAYSWAGLPEALNVADFDVVILNFEAFKDESVRTNVQLKRLPSTEHFARLIFSEGSRVFAFGDPTVQFGGQESVFAGRQSAWSFQRGTWWLPIDLPVKADAGEVIQDVNPSWQFWFDHVRRFHWHFWDQPTSADPYRHRAALNAAPWAEGFVATWKPLAATRYGDPIAIQLEISAYRTTKRQTQFTNAEYRTERAPGEVYWLPTPTEVSQHEAIDLLLREIGITVESQPPAWLDDFLLPEYRRKLAALSRERAQLETARERLATADAAAAEQSRFERLLFEQGKDALEPVVREALTRLGATVFEPAVPGIEDGRLIDPQGRQAMLEIKGRRGQLKLEDVRQLDGWMRTAIAEESWTGKGLLCANLKLEEPPDERSDLVAPNALAFAERVGIAIVTTSQLHEALREHETEGFDSKAFWDSLQSVSGLVGLPQSRRGSVTSSAR